MLEMPLSRVMTLSPETMSSTARGPCGVAMDVPGVKQVNSDRPRYQRWPAPPRRGAVVAFVRAAPVPVCPQHERSRTTGDKTPPLPSAAQRAGPHGPRRAGRPSGETKNLAVISARHASVARQDALCCVTAPRRRQASPPATSRPLRALPPDMIAFPRAGPKPRHPLFPFKMAPTQIRCRSS